MKLILATMALAASLADSAIALDEVDTSRASEIADTQDIWDVQNFDFSQCFDDGYASDVFCMVEDETVILEGEDE